MSHEPVIQTAQKPGSRGPASPPSARDEVRTVVAMSVPIVITTCSRMTMDVTDFVMMKWIGGDAQAALLPAQITLWCYIVLGLGIVSMVNTFVSQCLGRQRRADCSAYAWQGVCLALLFGLLGLALWPAIPAVVAWMGHEPPVQRMELAYLRIAVFSITPTLAAEALAGFFNGIHKPRVTMWTAIEGNGVNAVVALLLIFGLLGCPRLGIGGAAVGALAGTTYRALRLGLTLWSGSYARSYASRHTWRVDGAKLRGLLRVGAPQGVQWLSDVVVWSVFINILVGRCFGTTHLIATNIVWQYLRIGFMPCIGIGIALTALVGRAIGECDPARAVRLARIAMGGMLLYMGTLSLVYFLGRDSLVAWFNADPQIVRIGATVMICAAVFQVFDAMGIGYNAALRGAGDTLWPAVMFIVTHWVIIIGGGLAMANLRPELGSVGPWAAATTLIVLVGWLLWWRWHSRRWMAINIFLRTERRSADGPDPAPTEYPTPVATPDAAPP